MASRRRFIRSHCSAPSATITASSTAHHPNRLSSTSSFSSYSRRSSSRCARCSSRNYRVMLMRSLACVFRVLISASRMCSYFSGRLLLARKWVLAS